MIVSGIVLYLEPSAAADRCTRDALAGVPGLELGLSEGGSTRIPAVLERTSERESEEAVRALERVVGVQRVEVTFIGFDGPPHPTARP